MNYPVWDVSFGAGLLIALISVLHVFISHFAVGGGLFLVLTEKKAYRENDTALLEWLKRHTKFFVLVTVVLGAVTGVGIWFTIALVHPSGTSTLIHSYVWGWAIEWVFFFLEITAALLYLYGWNKLDRRTHLWFGWIYFIAAFASMVIINGILTFMLTSGRWIENREFWVGFFNPTYFPSLFLRFAFALALAGIYALLTASVQKDAALKAKIVKWSAWWIVPAFVVLPLFAYWYVRNIAPEVWSSSQGLMPTATFYADLILIFSVVTFVLSLLTLVKPAKLHIVFSLLVMASAFTTMWAFEFIREAIRKPYIIANYMYANSIYKTPMPGDGGFTIAQLNQNGVLHTAKWVSQRELTAENQVAVGQEIFRVQCQSCHTVAAYRGVKAVLQQRNWESTTLFQMLGSLDAMHNGTMPPFGGTEAERAALAAFLSGLYSPSPAAGLTDGQAIFASNCAPCHRAVPADRIYSQLRELDEETISVMVEDLQGLNARMPQIQLSAEQRLALAQWLRQ